MRAKLMGKKAQSDSDDDSDDDSSDDDGAGTLTAVPLAFSEDRHTAATSAPGLGSPLPHVRGLGSPLPHLHRDWAHPCHICTGAGLTPATSAPGLGSHWPHLHQDWAHPGHICTGTRHWHERVAICMLYVECGSGDAQRTEKQRREALEFDKKMRDKLLLRSQPQACCTVYGVWCIVANCTLQMREKPRPRNEPRARGDST